MKGMFDMKHFKLLNFTFLSMLYSVNTYANVSGTCNSSGTCLWKYAYDDIYNECLRKRYTLPEADAATSDDNENMIEWIFE